MSDEPTLLDAILEQMEGPTKSRTTHIVIRFLEHRVPLFDRLMVLCAVLVLLTLFGFRLDESRVLDATAYALAEGIVNLIHMM